MKHLIWVPRIIGVVLLTPLVLLGLAVAVPVAVVALLGYSMYEADKWLGTGIWS